MEFSEILAFVVVALIAFMIWTNYQSPPPVYIPQERISVPYSRPIYDDYYDRPYRPTFVSFGRPRRQGGRRHRHGGRRRSRGGRRRSRPGRTP